MALKFALGVDGVCGLELGLGLWLWLELGECERDDAAVCACVCDWAAAAARWSFGGTETLSARRLLLRLAVRFVAALPRERVGARAVERVAVADAAAVAVAAELNAMLVVGVEVLVFEVAALEMLE